MILTVVQLLVLALCLIAFMNIAAVFVVHMLGWHVAVDAPDYSVKQTGDVAPAALVTRSTDRADDGEDKPLSAQKISEIYATMKVGGGYKPKPMPGDDGA